MKNVVLLSPFLAYGGAEKQFLKLINVLRDDKSCRILICVLSSDIDDIKISGTVEDERVSVRHYGCNPIEVGFFRKFYAITKVIYDLMLFRPNYIYAYSLYLFPVYFLSLFIRARFIYSERILSEATRKRKWLYKIISFFSDCIVVNSDTLKEFFSGFSVRAKVIHIPNSVQRVEFDETDRKSNGVFRMAVVSRLSAEKNIEYLLESLKDNQINPCEINLYYSAADISYKEYLEKIVGQCSVAVNFRGCSSLVNIYSKNDIVVHPTKAEGTPNVVIEGMLSRVPIFCSRIQENVDTGIDQCFLFSLDDEGEELVDKISQWIEMSNYDKYERMDRNFYQASMRFAHCRFVENIKVLFG